MSLLWLEHRSLLLDSMDWEAFIPIYVYAHALSITIE